MKKIITLALLFLTLSNYSFSQEKSTTNKMGKRKNGGLGIGLGLPYGSLGLKITENISYAQFSLGAGFVPYIFSPSFAASLGLQSPSGFNNIYPKLSISASNTGGVIYLYNSETEETLYEKTFPGYGIYLGFEIYIPEYSFSIDINGGYVGTFIGDKEFLSEYRNAVKQYNTNYFFKESHAEKLSPSGIKGSIGVIFYF